MSRALLGKWPEDAMARRESITHYPLRIAQCLSEKQFANRLPLLDNA
jgi:hypothetical protein